MKDIEGSKREIYLIELRRLLLPQGVTQLKAQGHSRTCDECDLRVGWALEGVPRERTIIPQFIYHQIY